MDLNCNNNSAINREILQPNEQIIEDIVIELRTAVDQLSKSFAEAKSLILELARAIDERKQCQQSEICRRIKEILKDKIDEGKITGKWIEECLPQEYKRKYTKSELASLSEDANKNVKKITVSNKGEAFMDSSTFGDSSISKNDYSTEDTIPTLQKHKLEKNNDSLLPFEFALGSNDIFYQVCFSSDKEVWFHGILDKNTLNGVTLQLVADALFKNITN